MIHVERKILEQIIKLSKNVTSKDATRYFLNAVCLDSPRETRRLRIKACDGHRLFESTWDVESLPELLENKECLIYPEAIKRIELLLKLASKRQLSFFADITDNKLFLNWSTNKIEDAQFVGIVKSKGEYPNSDAIKPKNDGYTFEVGFNAEYLLKLLNASRSDSKNVKLTFKAMQVNETWQIDKLAPILVDACKTENEYALLMPVKI